jgi:alkylated DNA repair dioxygenase AlkB
MQLLKTIDKIQLKDAGLIIHRGKFDEFNINRFSEIKFDQNKIEMYGKQYSVPRLEAWFGDKSYTYTGMKLKPRPYPTWLLELQQDVESLTGSKFNSALINKYRDGEDHVSWHSDDEECLGESPIITSISFGAERSFQLKHKNDRESKISIELYHGDMLIMEAGTQGNWKHRVPKRKRITEVRFNITFRKIN